MTSVLPVVCIGKWSEVYAASVGRNRSWVLSNSAEISMSKEHLEDFGGWQRPIELLKNRYLDSPQQSGVSKPAMLPFKAIDLVQDVTADCSVVASLCAALARPGSSFIDVRARVEKCAHR